VECQKEGTEECDCVCHLLQKDYDSRPHWQRWWPLRSKGGAGREKVDHKATLLA
jgi:hypothetical protein